MWATRPAIQYIACSACRFQASLASFLRPPKTTKRTPRLKITVSNSKSPPLPVPLIRRLFPPLGPFELSIVYHSHPTSPPSQAMPSHSSAAALIRLYNACDQAPWSWPTWQGITGIHNGLFSEEDRHLPPGWTREDSSDIHSWFIHARASLGASDYAENAQESADRPDLPGKQKWMRFVQRKWEAWNVHGTVVKILRENNIHPIQIIVNEGNLQTWPSADTFSPIAIDAVGLAIFGSEALGPKDIFSLPVRRCISDFIQRSWSRIRVQVMRDRGKLASLEEGARAAFRSESVYLAALVLHSTCARARRGCRHQD